MFCLISCTVQATAPEDVVSRTDVFYVVPDREGQSGPTDGAEEEGQRGETEDAVAEEAQEDGDTDAAWEAWKRGEGPLRRVVRRGQNGGITKDPWKFRAERAMFDSISVALGESLGEYEEVIFVEHRGKGVVRRRRDALFASWGMWERNADYFGHHTDAYHWIPDGYSAVWVTCPQHIFIPQEPAAKTKKKEEGNNNGSTIGSGHAAISGGGGGFGSFYAPSAPGRPSRPAYTPTRPVEAPVRVPGTLNNGGTLHVPDTSVLSGDWLLDFGLPVEVDFGGASTPLALSNGTLNIVSGNGLTLNLQGRWDGASDGSFELIGIGTDGVLQFNGAEVTEGRNYLDDLGSLTVRYTDAEGNAASHSAADGDGLLYSLEVQDGVLSLVISGLRQPTAMQEEAPTLMAAPVRMMMASAPPDDVRRARHLRHGRACGGPHAGGLGP